MKISKKCSFGQNLVGYTIGEQNRSENTLHEFDCPPMPTVDFQYFPMQGSTNFWLVIKLKIAQKLSFAQNLIDDPTCQQNGSQNTLCEFG